MVVHVQQSRCCSLKLSSAECFVSTPFPDHRSWGLPMGSSGNDGFCLMSLPTKYLLETKLKLTKTQTQHIFRWAGKSRQPAGTWVSILSSPSSKIPEHLQSCVALWQVHLLTIPGQEERSLAHLYPLSSACMKCASKMSL